LASILETVLKKFLFLVDSIIVHLIPVCCLYFRGLLYTGSLDCLIKTATQEGVMALYKGFIPIWLRMVRELESKFWFCLRYPMYNDHIFYLVNGWWNFCELDIILKGLSNKNSPPLEFSEFWFALDLSHLWFYIEVYGESTYNSDIFKINYIFR
jgi:hypothetical protein